MYSSWGGVAAVGQASGSRASTPTRHYGLSKYIDRPTCFDPSAEHHAGLIVVYSGRSSPCGVPRAMGDVVPHISLGLVFKTVASDGAESTLAQARSERASDVGGGWRVAGGGDSRHSCPAGLPCMGRTPLQLANMQLLPVAVRRRRGANISTMVPPLDHIRDMLLSLPLAALPVACSSRSFGSQYS